MVWKYFERDIRFDMDIINLPIKFLANAKIYYIHAKQNRIISPFPGPFMPESFISFSVYSSKSYRSIMVLKRDIRSRCMCVTNAIHTCMHTYRTDPMENDIPLFQKGASYLRIKQGNVVFIEFNASVIVKQVIILFGAS